MSLKGAIRNFDEPIMQLSSGKQILEDYIKPLLANSKRYLKISSFFTPSVIRSVLEQLEECFRHKGHVKLIIGVHDSRKLLPVLDRIQNDNLDTRFKLAVQNIVRNGIEECLALANDPNDFLNVLSELIKQDLIQDRKSVV